MGNFTVKNKNNVASKKTHNKHYWWRYTLTFIGGFLGCIVAIVLTGGGLAAATPAKNVVSTFGGNPNDIIGVKYQDSTILQIILDATNTKFETLGDISEFTPLVEKLIKDTLPAEMENKCRKVFPIKSCLIRKVKTIKRPRFDLTQLMSMQGDTEVPGLEDKKEEDKKEEEKPSDNLIKA